jgi:hypothetical protein
MSLNGNSRRTRTSKALPLAAAAIPFQDTWKSITPSAQIDVVEN